jgi:asparagine synthase (glutamine-hydrolysing)
VDTIHSELEEAVRLRLIADVPLGSFLSGGLDSSLVVALAMRHGHRPFHTFSIRAAGADASDADAARIVARALGSTHHEEVLACPQPDDVRRMLRHFDEPFADSSLIPTWAVSDAARREVTVALSGDGADEMFGGYAAYATYARLDTAAKVPGVRYVSRLARRIWPAGVLGSATLSILSTAPNERYARVAALVRHEALGRLVTDSAVADAATDEIEHLNRLPPGANRIGAVARAQWIDAARTYLPGDILPKVDMASMANSLEVRCPYLDHVLAEALRGVPDHLRFDGRHGKVLLRQIARRYLPDQIISRRKVGFAVPLHVWFGEGLRPLVDAYVQSGTTPMADYVDLSAVRSLLAGTSDPVRRSRLEFSFLSLAVWAEGQRASHRKAQATGLQSAG